jgi:hypothetical protein
VSTQQPAATTIPSEYAALVDDAAIFPPGNASLGDAVRDYRRHGDGPYAALVGPFVVGDVRLPELIDLLAAGDDAAPLPVTVVVSGGAGALEPATRWATGTPLLELRGLEIALRDLDDLAGAARRVVTAADLGVDVPVHIEPPLQQVATATWLAALDEVAAADLRLKFRTGGLEADAFPSAGVLAAAIDAALDRELPFKCTAGLHHAVRHRAPDTGFEHHGFLNVLLATRAALDGDDIAAALEEHDAEAVVAGLDAVGSDALVRARRLFTSFGCCGIDDPLSDLIALGLVDEGG